MNRRALVGLLVVVGLLGVALWGCGPSKPEGEPAISGDVQVVTPSGNSGVAFLVETDEVTAEAKKYVSNAAMVNVDKKTKVFDETGAKVDPKNIVVDTKVDVWFAGPVAESYPVQGVASFIRVYQRGTVPPGTGTNEPKP